MIRITSGAASSSVTASASVRDTAYWTLNRDSARARAETSWTVPKTPTASPVASSITSPRLSTIRVSPSGRRSR